jgi:hypothetical protein
MPKFNQSLAPKARDKNIPLMPLINPRHINVQQHRKIPPPPPQRQIFRSDPEGMPVTAEFQEKKNAQLAVVKQTNLPQIPPKPFANFGQPNLLNRTIQNQFVFAQTNANLNNFGGSSAHQRSQFTHFSTLRHHNAPSLMFHNPKQQLMPARVTNDYVENRAEKSDPENHIYEMIDENEVSGINFHHAKAEGTKENSNLFQNLLRAEMMNQIQSCSKIGSNGYLSHLTQEKRMDIIEETAKSLASAAYLEK